MFKLTYVCSVKIITEGGEEVKKIYFNRAIMKSNKK